MRKIAVLGARGMLGYAVREYFSRKGDDVIALGRLDFDIARNGIDTLASLLEGADAVINCAGVIKPMITSTPIEDVIKVNSIFPYNLGKHCARQGIPCFHVTTDCIYNGQKGGYTEDDFVDAEDVYGLSKAAGDASPAMVLRTSIIGEEEGQPRSLLAWAKGEAGNTVNGFTNHLWNGVTTLHLAEVIGRILDDNRYAQGIFHIHSPDSVSKYELLQIFSEVYALSLTINSMEAGSACDRTIASVHSLSGELCHKPIRQQVAEMKEFFFPAE